MNSLIVSLSEKMKRFYWRCLPEESLVTLMEKASEKSLSDDRDGDQSRSPVTISWGKNKTNQSPLFFYQQLEGKSNEDTIVLL